MQDLARVVRTRLEEVEQEHAEGDGQSADARHIHRQTDQVRWDNRIGINRQ